MAVRIKIPDYLIDLHEFFNFILKLDELDELDEADGDPAYILELKTKFTVYDIGLNEEIIDWLGSVTHRLFFDTTPYVTSFGTFSISPVVELEENDMIYFKLTWI